MTLQYKVNTKSPLPLYGTYKTVKARLWPYLPGKVFNPFKVLPLCSEATSAADGLHIHPVRPLYAPAKVNTKSIKVNATSIRVVATGVKVNIMSIKVNTIGVKVNTISMKSQHSWSCWRETKAAARVPPWCTPAAIEQTLSTGVCVMACRPACAWSGADVHGN